MLQATDALHLLRHYLNLALPDHVRNDPDCQAEITDMLAYFEALDKRITKLEAPRPAPILKVGQHARLQPFSDMAREFGPKNVVITGKQGDYYNIQFKNKGDKIAVSVHASNLIAIDEEE